MAMLATLEGIENNRGGIFGACMGACEMVANTVRGCLGAIPQKKIFQSSLNFYIPDLNYSTGFNAIRDVDERMIAQGTGSMDASIGIVSSKKKYGIGDVVDKVTVNTWLLPIQNFLNYLWQTLINYPEMNIQGAAGKAYFSWLANNPKPNDIRLQTAWDAKVNALNEFMAGMGWWDSVVKARAEESRKKQGLVAQSQAAAAAEAYAEAMRKKAEQEKQIEKEYQEMQEQTEQSLPKTENGTGSIILPILGLAAAALAFMG